MEKAQNTPKTPYLGVNGVIGGARQDVRHDSWFIMVKGIARSEFNRAGEEMVEGIPASEGYDKVIERLHFYAKQKGLSIAPDALEPPSSAPPTPKAA